jgi:hypothetical protein
VKPKSLEPFLMSTGRHTFKHTDARRLVLAARDAGLKVRGLTLDRDGNITVLADDSEAPSGDDNSNPWDKVLGDDQDAERPA